MTPLEHLHSFILFKKLSPKRKERQVDQESFDFNSTHEERMVLDTNQTILAKMKVVKLFLFYFFVFGQKCNAQALVIYSQKTN